MARSRNNVETEVSYIQEGLVAVTQKCPEYGGQPLPGDDEATPEAEPGTGG
jgi:hypothetical protein